MLYNIYEPHDLIILPFSLALSHYNNNIKSFKLWCTLSVYKSENGNFVETVNMKSYRFILIYNPTILVGSLIDFFSPFILKDVLCGIYWIWI